MSSSLKVREAGGESLTSAGVFFSNFRTRAVYCNHPRDTVGSLRDCDRRPYLLKRLKVSLVTPQRLNVFVVFLIIHRKPCISVCARFDLFDLSTLTTLALWLDVNLVYVSELVCLKSL